MTKRLFRSRANYFEPAGAVSWDVSMSATGPNWKVAIKKGDVLSITRDLRHDARLLVRGDGHHGRRHHERRPTAASTRSPTDVDQTDYLTHGRLPENVDIGVRRPNPGLSNPLRLRRGPLRDRIVIKNFAFQQGDLTLARQARAAADRAAGQAAHVRQPGRPADDPLPHDHRL